jgi:hypothetical protein
MKGLRLSTVPANFAESQPQFFFRALGSAHCRSAISLRVNLTGPALATCRSWKRAHLALRCDARARMRRVVLADIHL